MAARATPDVDYDVRMADEYERGHMAGVGEVLHRVKASVGRGLFAFVAITPLLAAAIASATLIGAAPAVTMGIILGSGALASLGLGTLMLVFAGVRLVISEGEVSAQLGFAGPRVAVADIVSVSRGYSGTNSYGLGVMRDFQGNTILKMFGDNATAVHLHKKDGTKLVLVTKENDAVFAAVQEALARRDAKLPRVRVEGVAEDVRAEDARAEDAEAEQARARRHRA